MITPEKGRHYVRFGELIVITDIEVVTDRVPKNGELAEKPIHKYWYRDARMESGNLRHDWFHELSLAHKHLEYPTCMDIARAKWNTSP